jgi:uncharacterized membrane protein
MATSEDSFARRARSVAVFAAVAAVSAALPIALLYAPQAPGAGWILNCLTVGLAAGALVLLGALAALHRYRCFRRQRRE